MKSTNALPGRGEIEGKANKVASSAVVVGTIVPYVLSLVLWYLPQQVPNMTNVLSKVLAICGLTAILGLIAYALGAWSHRLANSLVPERAATSSVGKVAMVIGTLDLAVGICVIVVMLFSWHIDG